MHHCLLRSCSSCKHVYRYLCSVKPQGWGVTDQDAVCHICCFYHTVCECIRSQGFHILIESIYISLIILSAVAGVWQEWGQWSECDPSCSCGKKMRARACTTPTAAACSGEPTETAPCSSESSNLPLPVFQNAGFSAFG